MACSRETFHQILSLCPVYFAVVLMGMDMGWIAPVLKQSQEPNYDISLSVDECTWIAALPELAKICGAIISTFAVDLIGRKMMLLAISLLNLFGWILIKSKKSFSIICVSRVVFGTASGMCDSLAHITIGENSSAELRGIFLSINITLLFIGLVIEYVLATYLAYDTVTFINITISFLAVLSVVLMKETVQFLIMKNKYDEAEKNYNWLFSKDKYGLKNMKESIRPKLESVHLYEFFRNSAYYKSIAMVVFPMVLITATGYWTLIPFVSMIFSSSSTLTPKEFTIYFGFIQAVSALAPTTFIERFKRRSIFMLTLTISGLTHASTAALYYVQDNVTPISNFPWLVFTTISLYSITFLMGTYPLVCILRAEVFPQKIKPLGNGLSILAGSVTAFIISLTFFDIADIFGHFANFLLFSVASWLALIFVYLFVPETKGKSLVEIQTMLSDLKTNSIDADERIRRCCSLEKEQIEEPHQPDRPIIHAPLWESEHESAIFL